MSDQAEASDDLVDQLVARAAATGGLVLELVDRHPPGTRCRWYGVHLQPSLWRGTDVVRQWGRIGCGHRPRRLVTPHPSRPAACDALPTLLRRRLRRGYLPVAP